MITLQRVAYTIPGRTLLHPLDLQFASGEVCGLIGHNGSGKSTLLRLLANQLTPAAGSIRLDGRALADFPTRELARHIAWLPQHPPATDQLTVRELVRFGRQPWHGLLGRFGREDAAAVDEALALTGMASLADRQVDTLSGGERQRGWLAMLLAQRTRYLLLDEPTSALDIAHQVEVLQLIRDLSQRLQPGIILVLHDINMAARYCDRLVALRGGRLLYDGTPASLMQPDCLQAIYGLPMQVIPHPVDGSPGSVVL